MAHLLLKAGRLALRAGRLVYSTCRACCGPCVLYWQANACSILSGGDPTEICGPPPAPPPQPPPIYVPQLAQCFGRPVQPGDRLYVDGKCYVVTNIVFRAPTSGCNYPPLPPDARVIDGAPCIPQSCNDPLCSTLVGGIGRALPCDERASGFPPVYFCRGLLTQCGYGAVSPPGAPGAGFCYRFDPAIGGATPPIGAVVFTSAADLPPMFPSCCTCTAGIEDPVGIPCRPCPVGSTTVDGLVETVTNGPPCCVDVRQCQSMTVSGEFRDFYNDGTPHEWTTIDPQTVDCGGTRNVFKHIRLYDPDGSVVVDNPHDLFFAGSANCPGYPTGGNSGGIFGIVATPGIRWTTTYDCDHWGYTLSTAAGGYQANGRYSISVHRGLNQQPCIGKCGMTGLAGNVALPPEQWPVWATTIGRLRTGVDAGVGDTIARLIGAETSAAIKRFIKSVAGVDCGCEARRGTFNALYPYGTT